MFSVGRVVETSFVGARKAGRKYFFVIAKRRCMQKHNILSHISSASFELTNPPFLGMFPLHFAFSLSIL